MSATFHDAAPRWRHLVLTLALIAGLIAATAPAQAQESEPQPLNLELFGEIDPLLLSLFDPERTSYDVPVPPTMDAFTVTIPALPEQATVTVNGQSYTEGETVSVTLPVGTTVVTVAVTDGDGGSGGYTIVATRPAPPSSSGGSGGGSPTPTPTPTTPSTPDPVREANGNLPAPGAGRASVGGKVVALDVRPGTADGAVAIAGPGFDLEVAPTGDDAATAPAGHLVLGQGRPADVTVSGFAPNSPVRLWLFSTPTLLGEFETGADGTLTATTAELGDDVTACRHTLHAEGELPGGDAVSLSLGVWVDAVPYPYADVAPDATHARAIACLRDRDVIDGVGPDSFAPARTLSRGQAASLVARMLDLDLGGVAAFPDAAASAHTGGVAAAVDAGLMRGYGDGTFGPGRPITRAQLATLLAAAADLDTDRPSAFADTDGSVHAGAIAALVDAGVVSGYGDTRFAPVEPVSRAQAASMLMAVQDLLAD